MKNGIVCLLGFILCSCVSTQQYNETVEYFETQQAFLESQVDSLGQLSDSLRFDIARRQGENNALLTVQDKLQDRIDFLQEQLEDLGSRAVNKEQTLSQEIKAREAAIAAKEREIESLKNLLEEYNNSMNVLSDTIEYRCSEEIESGILLVENKGAQLIISLPFDQLFSSSRSLKFSDEGIGVLEKLSQVFEKNPDKYITVIAHTDNSAPNNRYYKDNWDFSALQASAVVRLMTEEFYLNPNQITASAKGEFAPRTSNATEEGKKANKRIELKVNISEITLMRNLRKQLEAMTSTE